MLVLRADCKKTESYHRFNIGLGCGCQPRVELNVLALLWSDCQHAGAHEPLAGTVVRTCSAQGLLIVV